MRKGGASALVGAALLWGWGAGGVPSLSAMEAVKHAGFWENGTYGSFGAVAVYMGRGDADFDFRMETTGFVLGSLDPVSPIVLEGPIGPGGVEFDIPGHDRFGRITGSLTLTGELEIQMPDVPGDRVDAMTITGMATFDGIDATYRIEFETATPPGERVEGVDFAVGTIKADPDRRLPSPWVGRAPTGDTINCLAVGDGSGGVPVAVAGARSLVVRTGGGFVEGTTPAEVRPRKFVGAAYDGTKFMTFDDRHQTYCSDDGLHWKESGRLPGDAVYRDVAADAVAGRFVFVGDGGRVDAFRPGEWADDLAPEASWTVPGAPDLVRAKKLGGSVYLGGSGGTVARWGGDAAGATSEQIAGAEVVSDLAMSPTHLVAATSDSLGASGPVFKRMAAGGDWSDAGFTNPYSTVAFNSGTGMFAFGNTTRASIVTGADLVEPEFQSFGGRGYTRVASWGDGFLLGGREGVIAEVSAEGAVSQLGESPIEWPFNDMLRIDDQLLLLSRFGRIFYLPDDSGDQIQERWIFSGFNAPSFQTHVPLEDGRYVFFCDENAGVALTSDGETFETYREFTDPMGQAVFPRVSSAAISEDGFIVGQEERGMNTLTWTTTPDMLNRFVLLGTTFSRYGAIDAAGATFLRAGSRLQTSGDGENWMAIDGAGADSYSAVHHEKEGDFALAGTSFGFVYKSDFGFSVATRVYSPVSTRIVDFESTGEGGIAMATEDGQVAVSRGGDFQVVYHHDAALSGLYFDEPNQDLYAYGDRGALLRFPMGDGEGGGGGAVNAVWEAWRELNFSALQLALPGVSGPGDDPEGDGDVNLIEAVKGGDPLANDAPLALEPSYSDAGQMFAVQTWVHRDALDLAEFQVEVSGDGEVWAPVGAPEAMPVGLALQLRYEVAPGSLPGGGDPTLVRLQVTLRPGP